ncbi:MAG TPA: J domain-containing protein [Xanthobacteraceae bacterium]|nr:J domain-containing protein [Xanthobacteraceae bacterium]
MVVPESGGELSALVVNAVLLALWAALPGLILGYIRQALAARKMPPHFALRKSEIAELERAMALYDRVCNRLETIERQAATPARFWRALFDRADDTPDAEEREDLQAHARHLRGTIARLKRRPLQRLYSWVHAASAQSALAGAIAAYGTALALAIAASQAPGQAAWADELNARPALVWYPLDARLFYANAVASGFAVAAAAMFYLLRRGRLRRDYELEICAFRDLAYSDPLRAAEPPPEEDPAAFDPSQWTEANENNAADTWFAVLGLSSAATIEDVRDAYKTLIKQNHPDRVHGMAPIFRALAEAETKKINAAYRQALLRIGQAERHAA